MNTITNGHVYAAYAIGALTGALTMFALSPRPSQTPYPQELIDSLSGAVQYHKMMQDSAWAEAVRFAAQRDSALSNPTFIHKTVYRNAVQKSLDAGGLYDVLDTLGAPADDWIITR